jgi:MerR family transcriptional regulator, light-induced transcriptional regulator
LEIYSINDVEQLTGIKAHTLRILEKRYNALLPHRTATHIRYYDDDQLRRLLNVTTLLAMGHKISHILSYPEEKINELILSAGENPAVEPVYEAAINSLTQAMIGFDEPSFEHAMNKSFSKFGANDTVLRVMYPFLRRTGMLWSTSNIAPAQEHFASHLVRRRLFTMVDALLPLSPNAPLALLFLPPDEWHDIGLIFAEYQFRQLGVRTVLLGQNVPYDSVNAAVDKLRPDYILTFMVAGQDKFRPFLPLIRMATTYPDMKLIYAAIRPDTSGTLPANIVFLTQPEALPSLLM